MTENAAGPVKVALMKPEVAATDAVEPLAITQRIDGPVPVDPAKDHSTE
jgi:hypothetical protein